MKKAVQVILINENNEVLAVSRKTDHNDFGLPGGKMEDCDSSTEECIIRECKEETGLDIYDLVLIHNSVWGSREQFTYLAKYKDQPINTTEPHVVKWTSREEIINGSFGEYNKIVFELI